MSAESADVRYDAFLCYSGRDWAFATLLYRFLTEAGFNVFLDSEALRRGMEQTPAVRGASNRQSGVMHDISNAVRNARVFILLVTPEALDSSWVQVELEERGNQPRVFVDLEWTEIPRNFESGGHHVNLQPGGLSRPAYLRRYRKGLARICSLLREGADDHRTADPVRHVVPVDHVTRLPEWMRRKLARAIQPLVDTTALGEASQGNVVRAPDDDRPSPDQVRSVRLGLCAALDILGKGFAASFERTPLCKHPELLANHVLVALARRWSPWRGALHLARVLQHGFLLQPGMRTSMREIAAQCEVRIRPDVDDEFIARVQDVLWPRYTITNVLGGSSTITMCAHDQDLGRSVAIKVLRIIGQPDVDRDRELAFQELIRNAARAPGSGIAKILGARFGDNGLHLCVVEFLSGECLARLVRSVRETPISTADLAEVISRLGSVLAELEASGRAHLMLAKHSVFIMPDGGVLLLPVGIVELGRKRVEMVRYYRKIRDERDMVPARDQRLTPKFMQFLLGRIATEMLLGEQDSRSDHQAPITEQLRAVMDEGSDVATLAAVLERLTADDATVRFCDMKDAVGALRSAVRACRAKKSRSLAAALTWVAKQRSEEPRRHTLVQESLARALRRGLVSRFRERLWSHADIHAVFARQGSIHRIPEYEDKLRIALRTIAVYGVHEGYRPLKIDALANTHGPDGFGITSSMYNVFCDDLIETLRECDPVIRRATEVGRTTLAGWRAMLDRVVGLLMHAHGSAILPSGPMRPPTDAPD